MAKQISRSAWLRKPSLKRLSTGLALLALGLIAPPIAAQSPNPYDTIINAIMARYHLPGIAVGVIEHGKVVYTATRGETVAGSG
ncbi:MAG TPA: hypothetical protein VFJ26_10235, partial [Dyella sp.]|nr:hypothetical protein [Dyella sp.]